MSKSDRISDLIGSAPKKLGAPDPRYAAFFDLFNMARYFEAHDVLEHLWLRERGTDQAFYKGLIQVAGGFVHLQKQQLRPEHPKDRTRLRPACRLFRLARENLQPFAPFHLSLDVRSLCDNLQRLCEEIEDGEFRRNPWNPTQIPSLNLGSDPRTQ